MLRECGLVLRVLLTFVVLLGFWHNPAVRAAPHGFRFKRASFYMANETACVVDGVVFQDGDPIPSDDPCESCKCRPPGFACILRKCEVKPGCKAVRKEGECCPEYVCGCEHNGQLYQDGETIRNTESPCYTCKCQGASIACALVDCYFRHDCAPTYAQGECCPRYDNCSPEKPYFVNSSEYQQGKNSVRTSTTTVISLTNGDKTQTEQSLNEVKLSPATEVVQVSTSTSQSYGYKPQDSEHRPYADNPADVLGSGVIDDSAGTEETTTAVPQQKPLTPNADQVSEVNSEHRHSTVSPDSKDNELKVSSSEAIEDVHKDKEPLTSSTAVDEVSTVTEHSVESNGSTILSVSTHANVHSYVADHDHQTKDPFANETVHELVTPVVHSEEKDTTTSIVVNTDVKEHEDKDATTVTMTVTENVAVYSDSNSSTATEELEERSDETRNLTSESTEPTMLPEKSELSTIPDLQESSSVKQEESTTQLPSVSLVPEKYSPDATTENTAEIKPTDAQVLEVSMENKDKIASTGSVLVEISSAQEDVIEKVGTTESESIIAAGREGEEYSTTPAPVTTESTNQVSSENVHNTGTGDIVKPPTSQTVFDEIVVKETTQEIVPPEKAPAPISTIPEDKISQKTDEDNLQRDEIEIMKETVKDVDQSSPVTESSVIENEPSSGTASSVDPSSESGTMKDETTSQILEKVYTTAAAVEEEKDPLPITESTKMPETIESKDTSLFKNSDSDKPEQVATITENIQSEVTVTPETEVYPVSKDSEIDSSVLEGRDPQGSSIKEEKVVSSSEMPPQEEAKTVEPSGVTTPSSTKTVNPEDSLSGSALLSLGREDTDEPVEMQSDTGVADHSLSADKPSTHDSLSSSEQTTNIESHLTSAMPLFLSENVESQEAASSISTHKEQEPSSTFKPTVLPDDALESGLYLNEANDKQPDGTETTSLDHVESDDHNISTTVKEHEVILTQSQDTKKITDIDSASAVQIDGKNTQEPETHTTETSMKNNKDATTTASPVTEVPRDFEIGQPALKRLQEGEIIISVRTEINAVSPTTELPYEKIENKSSEVESVVTQGQKETLVSAESEKYAEPKYTDKFSPVSGFARDDMKTIGIKNIATTKLLYSELLPGMQFFKFQPRIDDSENVEEAFVKGGSVSTTVPVMSVDKPKEQESDKPSEKITTENEKISNKEIHESAGTTSGSVMEEIVDGKDSQLYTEMNRSTTPATLHDTTTVDTVTTTAPATLHDTTTVDTVKTTAPATLHPTTTVDTVPTAPAQDEQPLSDKEKLFSDEVVKYDNSGSSLENSSAIQEGKSTVTSKAEIGSTSSDITEKPTASPSQSPSTDEGTKADAYTKKPTVAHIASTTTSASSTTTSLEDQEGLTDVTSESTSTEKSVLSQRTTVLASTPKLISAES